MSSTAHPTAPTLLVFDSGIGGLSIVDEIRRTLPNCRIVYVADNAVFPYGTQEESVLVNRLLHLLPHLERHAHPDLIIIACNTASTVVLEPLRAQTRTPIIGVVPAIKPAAQLTRNGVIGLLATPGTVKRHYVQRLIDEFAPHCTVLRVGSPELVHQAENKLRGRPVDLAVVAQETRPLLAGPTAPDIVILGCTHFPFLREEIQQTLPPTTRLIDSGAAIARRAGFLLQNWQPTTTGFPPDTTSEFLFTADTPQAHSLAEWLHLHGFTRMHTLDPSVAALAQKRGES